MYNEVKFTCNNDALPKITKMIKQLILISGLEESRVIRIGGDETAFNGKDEKLDNDLSINGVLDTTPYIATIPKRNRTNTGVTIPQQTPIPVPANQSVSTAPTPQSADPVVIAVSAEIHKLVSNNEMFTAWDVTREVNKNSLATSKHRDVKRIVHSMYTNGDMVSYRRELIDIDGVPEKPYLYLPASNNIDDYFIQKGISRRVDVNSSDVLTS